jgi:hypothetical protein
MKTLATQIKRELKTQVGHCAIYEDELQRLWPLNEENRKAKIEQFAKLYGFELSFYKQGLCAIFVVESGGPCEDNLLSQVTDASDSHWLWKDGQRKGPFTGQQLHRMAKLGEINNHTLFWSERRQQWLPLLHLLKP